jgi:hypothetical protein
VGLPARATTTRSPDLLANAVDGGVQLHRLEENIAAAGVELTADDLRDIERAVSGVTVQGVRYPEHLETSKNLGERGMI